MKNSIVFFVVLSFCFGQCFAGASYNEEQVVEQLLNEMPELKGGAVEMHLKLLTAQKKYNEAYENEQSLANRTLTAATTAAMGIGGMQLAQGLAEQKADEAADKDMTAYMETMRCSYADGKSVKMGFEPIELPGGNDSKLMQYRSEYLALAADLKQRKESLGMKPGIESETILDKAEMGLYDDENVGITGGSYSSLYRAKMGSETDQAKIDEDKEASANRVKGGAIAAGAGAGVGIVGNSLINGKLGENKDSASEKVKCEYKGTPGKSCIDVIPDRTHVLRAKYDENGCCVVTCKKGYTRTNDSTCVLNEEHEKRQAQGRLLQSEIINRENIQKAGDVIESTNKAISDIAPALLMAL